MKFRLTNKPDRTLKSSFRRYRWTEKEIMSAEPRLEPSGLVYYIRWRYARNHHNEIQINKQTESNS